jgi:hypothetical protein
MNQTTLVLVAALAASTLIIGTLGTLQPAAASYYRHHHHHHDKTLVKQSNNLEVDQQINQAVQCNASTTPGNCNNNYQQAANTAIVVNTTQANANEH